MSTLRLVLSELFTSDRPISITCYNFQVTELKYRAIRSASALDSDSGLDLRLGSVTDDQGRSFCARAKPRARANYKSDTRGPSRCACALTSVLVVSRPDLGPALYCSLSLDIDAGSLLDIPTIFEVFFLIQSIVNPSPSFLMQHEQERKLTNIEMYTKIKHILSANYVTSFCGDLTDKCLTRRPVKMTNVSGRGRECYNNYNYKRQPPPTRLAHGRGRPRTHVTTCA
ncbi:hypothetical protein EVAR_18080_1 [Eumeta japonica]|uniref:Uncharacterized protein n=1 Tax=Eumeta variegata TaxID=151549 RepID=A0A4C1VI67_EUMVA|nr:hypothetical protein EVAR_18080_1 [Eumeta japonica]